MVSEKFGQMDVYFVNNPSRDIFREKEYYIRFSEELQETVKI